MRDESERVRESVSERECLSNLSFCRYVRYLVCFFPCVFPRRSRLLEYVFSAEIFMISCDLLVSLFHRDPHRWYLHVFKRLDDFKFCCSFHVHSYADAVEEYVLLSALLRTVGLEVLEVM